MDRTDYILEAQKAGWLLFSSNREGLTFQCAHPGCHEAMFAPQSVVNREVMPEPCARQHVDAQGVTVESYQDAMTVIADARRRLGVDQNDVGATAGLADGHVNKIEAGHRHCTLPVLLSLAATVGLSVVLAPAPLPKQAVALVSGRAMRPMMSRWRAIPARRLGHERAGGGLFRLRRLGDDDVAA